MFDTYNTPISDVITLDSNISSRKIRIYIKWIDDEESQTMTNEADTLSTVSENPVLFNVNIAFTQIIENIPEDSSPPIV